MSTYKGKTFTVNKPSSEISDKFSDLTALRKVVDQLPEEEKKKIGEVEFNTDSIKVNTNQIGAISFNVVERTDKKVTMKAMGTPVPLQLDIDLNPKGSDSTDVTCNVDVDIPFMLRPMVAPHLNKAVEMLSDVIEKIVS